MLETCVFASRSHPGYDRESNEDIAAAYPDLGLLVVLDGMGGHRAGEIAAARAHAGILEYIRSEHGRGDPTEVLTKAIINASALVHNASLKGRGVKGMGTTAVLCLLRGNVAHIAHVGDSRAYLLRDGQLQLLTNDHTVALELFRSGALPHTELDTHPYRNMLARYIGAKGQIRPETTSVELRQGDRILLSTDGLHDAVPHGVLARGMKLQGGIEALADELIGLGLRAGGKDNIAVAVAGIGERETPRTTIVVRTRGADEFLTRRSLFEESAQRRQVRSLLAEAGIPKDASTRFLDVVVSDLRRGNAFQIWKFGNECANAWSAARRPFSALRDALESLRACCNDVLYDLEQKEESVGITVETAVLQILVALEGSIATFLSEQLRQVERRRLARLRKGQQEQKRSTLKLSALPLEAVVQFDISEHARALEAGARRWCERKGLDHPTQQILAMVRENLESDGSRGHNFAKWVGDNELSAAKAFSIVELSRFAFRAQAQENFSDIEQVIAERRISDIHTAASLLVSEHFVQNSKEAVRRAKESKKRTTALGAAIVDKEVQRLAREGTKGSSE